MPQTQIQAVADWSFIISEKLLAMFRIALE